MGVGPGDIRGSHTIRIFGTNDDEEILTDIWLDIERVDVIYVTSQMHDGQWQGVYLRLHWNDDPEDNTGGWEKPGEGNPGRVTGLKKICSPDEEDQEDPAEWVPVQNNILMDINENDEYNQVFSRIFNRTDGENTVRLVEARRCFHNDTSIDEKVKRAIEANPDWKQIVLASNLYEFIPETENRDDYIEVQYMSCTMRQTSLKVDDDPHGCEQWVQFSLKNSHYLNFTAEAEGPANENHGFDPPWALDPFQAIVNVSFGGLAVEFGDKDKDAPKDDT